MAFRRYTIDVVLAQPVRLYHLHNSCSLEELLQHLGLRVGQGGGALRLSRPKEVTDERAAEVPSDVLFVPVAKTMRCPSGVRLVGLVDSDFDKTGCFGVCSSETELVKLSDRVARFEWEVDYNTSHMLDPF